jgi:hypothetical protein
MGKPGVVSKSGAISKPVDKIDLGSGSSPWIKSLSSIVVAIGAVLIALSLHDPSSTTLNLAIQDITSSSSSAVQVVSRLLHDDVVLPDTVEVVIKEQPVDVVVVESEPVEPEPVESESVEPEPVESESVESEIVEPEHIEEVIPDQNVVDIIEWMVKGGAEFPHIKVVEYANEYRGVHATADLSADDVLAQIPDQFIITFDKARDSEIGQRLIKALPEYDDLDMSHYMISIFLVVEHDKAEASWWWPYLRTLPKHFQNMPPNYTPEEKELARQSRLDAVLSDRFQSDFNEICEALPDFCQQHSLETYKWARLVLRTRAFSLDRDGVDQTALQPFVDMINHDFTNMASWRYDQEGRRGQIYARRPIKAGDAVTISYGAKSNRCLLRIYGFAIPNNPTHEAILFIQLPDGESASGMLARRVAKTGNPHTEFYRIHHTITLSTSDDDFQAAMKLCRIAIATSDELDQHDSFDQAISLRNEAAALRYLQESIDAGLYKHTTTVDEDEVLLKSSSLSDNERNIIVTRLSEKLTLITMNEIIEDLLDLADPSVDKRSFNKRRYHQKYADHFKYVRSIAHLRRLSR